MPNLASVQFHCTILSDIGPRETILSYSSSEKSLIFSDVIVEIWFQIKIDPQWRDCGEQRFSDMIPDKILNNFIPSDIIIKSKDVEL